MPGAAVMQTEIAGLKCRRGKVRDIYDLGDKLVIVASDRISAFDWVLPTPIPDKGRVLTALSLFWFKKLGVRNHLISTDPKEMGPEFAAHEEELTGRTMMVHKAEVVLIECVARGYVAGSGWKDYKRTGKVCGVPLPEGLEESQQLPEVIFTPATKADEGHDINISFEEMVERVGKELSEDLRQRTIEIHSRGAEFARPKGIIIADTKFEFGKMPDGEIILIDEVLTPDSSRFWPVGEYRTGISPPSYDKQFVRNWLETTDWDKNSAPPPLPEDIIAKTREKYIEAYETLVEQPFPWK